MKVLNFFLCAGLIILSFTGCQSGTVDNKTYSQKPVEILSDSNDVKKNISDIYYLFPSPTEILTIISKGGLVFEPKLLNSVENREKYIKTNEQDLNLGIYLADLSYCALFARNRESLDYLETIKRMCDDAKLSSEINKATIGKVKENFNSVDSLIKIADEYFYAVISDLEENNRNNDAAIISTGAYIECLYLSVNLVKKYSEHDLILQKIMEQKHAFNNLYQYSQKYISKEELKKSFSYIKRINDIFSQFKVKNKNVEVKEDGTNHLIISGGSTPVFTELEFYAFKEDITQIRNSITK